MNSDEMWDVLELIASIDRRKLGLTDRQTWEALIGDLGGADAKLAVIAHYRESTEWIMPAHVRQHVEAIRAQRIDEAPPVQIPPELADDPAAANEWKRAQYAAIADGQAPPRAIRSAS